MKIKVTSEESGLVVDKEYDLCERAANCLRAKGWAVLVEPETIESPDVTDFSGYDDEKIAEFAVKADLPANITNRKTIVKRLIEMGFVPDTEE